MKEIPLGRPRFEAGGRRLKQYTVRIPVRQIQFAQDAEEGPNAFFRCALEAEIKRRERIARKQKAQETDT